MTVLLVLYIFADCGNLKQEHAQATKTELPCGDNQAPRQTAIYGLRKPINCKSRTLQQFYAHCELIHLLHFTSTIKNTLASTFAKVFAVDELHVASTLRFTFHGSTEDDSLSLIG